MDDAVLGYERLQVEAIQDIKGEDFGRFCRELIETEKVDRHASDIEVRGPFGSYKRDGGVDVRVEVKSPPRLSKDSYFQQYGVAFTDDEPGTTIISCKTGANLRTMLMRDVKERADQVVDALLAGGRFTILVNVPIDPDARPHSRKKKEKGQSAAPGGKKLAAGPAQRMTLREEIAAELWKHMKERSEDAKEPGQHIRFIDAHEILTYLRRRRPALPVEFRDKLDLRPRMELKSLDEWRKHHTLDRESPAFSADLKREDLLRQLVEALSRMDGDAYDRVVWMIGPPGVGKTRLAIEALAADASLRRRALVATAAELAVEALDRRRILASQPDALLVVDDCPPLDVERIARLFAATASPRSSLLILTPQSLDNVPGSVRAQNMNALRNVLAVEPMDLQAHRRLIEAELGADADPTRVEQIANLTEGYPWFAVLLARGVRQDPLALPEHATRESATDLALASPREARPDLPWEKLVRARASCLLAAMLTESVDWDTLSEVDREGLCRAVGASSWQEIRDDHAPACVRRGILRMRLGRTFKYVTPAILAREVARKLLGPPRPDGPEPRGRHIWTHARRFAPAFYERLELLGLETGEGQDLLGELALDVVKELRSRSADIDVLGRAGIPGDALRFAARHQPGQTALLLRNLVESTCLDVLRARRDVRRDLVFALESVARRSAGFEDAEPALFRLALAENEGFANNATAVWKELFLIELNPTYRSFEEKLPLLRERCLRGEPTARLLALGGLARALATHTFRRGDEQRDGPYATPTRAHAKQGRLEAWALAADLAVDTEPSVAAAARELLVSKLRGAVRMGLGAEVCERLLSVLSAFAEAELFKLREALHEIEAYDGLRIQASPRLAIAWKQLVARAAPRSYRERLRQAVGSWGTERRGTAGALDETLALESLAPPVPIRDELGWLESEAAVRSNHFLRILGRLDAGRTLLQDLLVRARRGQSVSADHVANYLQGWSDAGGAREVDELMRRLRKDAHLADTCALTVWRLGATDERVGWLVEDLRAGRLADGTIGALVWGSWENGASDPAIGELAEALLSRRTSTSRAVALSLLVHRAQRGPAPRSTWREPLLRALEGLLDVRLGGLYQHLWEEGAKLLVAMGEVDRVLDMALRFLRLSRERMDSAGWEVVHACAKQDPVATWCALAHELESEPERAYEFALEFQHFGPTMALPPDEVLAWVGRSAKRATLVAQMCDLHGEQLAPLVRGLLVRFGPESNVAHVLAGRAQSTPSVVTSLAEFTRERLHAARHWAQDSDPIVQRWAIGVLASLIATHEHHSAYEEYERRRWGT
ncbi:hypothetical protein WME94_13500 [Sorangium sp. So ce429]